jgi:cytochrome P450/NADPH-cytochrome P450 reductase
LLFYGCRGKADDLYREDFDAWESQGAVTVKRAYSRENSEESCGCKYVQERMLREAGQIGELWDHGAKLYICGSRAMNDGAEKAFVQLLKERKGIDEGGARAFLDSVRSERVATDVFT